VTTISGLLNDKQPKDDPDDDQSMSLLTGVAGGGDALDGVIVDEGDAAGRSPWVHTLALLAVVAVLGAGALYFMRSTQDNIEARGTAGLATKIEDTLARLTNADVMSPDDPLSAQSVNTLFSDTDRVLAIFAANPAEKQVPVHLIKKNPFSIRVQRIVEETGEPEPEVDLEARQRMAQFEQAFKRLELQSVVDMRVPVAVINGDMYRKGDHLHGFFVAAISSKHQAVKLTAAGRDWVLRMETGVH
jgi:hypothetical protein